MFLSLAGLVPLFGRLPGAEAATPPATPRLPGNLVVVKGWVLTRDDLDHLPSA